MRENKLVSIAIATYNGQDTLKDCFTSATNQIYKNKEILVADDQSTDNTLGVILSFPFECQHSLLKNHSRLGIAGNYNQLLFKSNGDFFVLFDQDDTRSHNFISSSIEKLDKESVVGVIPRIDVYFNGELQHRNYYNFDQVNLYSRIWKYLRYANDFVPYALLKKNSISRLAGWTDGNSSFHRLSFGLLLEGLIVANHETSMRYNAKGFVGRPKPSAELMRNNPNRERKSISLIQKLERPIEYSKIIFQFESLGVLRSLTLLCLVWFDYILKSSLKLISILLWKAPIFRSNKSFFKFLEFLIYPTDNIEFITDRFDASTGYYKPGWPIR